MQLFDGLLRNRKFHVLFVNQLERIAIPSHFFFVAIPQGAFPEHNRFNPHRIHLHTLNAIGGDRAFNQGVLAENFESLWRLFGEQLLLAPRFA